MNRPEERASSHASHEQVQSLSTLFVAKFKWACSTSRILLFTLCVAVMAAASFHYATKTFGITEERDQIFFLSILIVSEISFWLSAGFCRLCAGTQKGNDNSIRRSFYEGWIFPILAAVFGCVAFLVASPDPKVGVLSLAAVFALQGVLGRLSQFKFIEVLEIPAALGAVCFAFWLMVLASYKDVHHWSYYLGPVYTVLQGGHLLWDVPSQYGFLNILSIATLSRVSGLSAELAMSHLLVIIEAFALGLTFYFFRFRLGISTFVSAMLAATFHLCLPGWIEMYSGPAYVPSCSALRFFPSMAALLCFQKSVQQPSRAWVLFSGALIAVASMWSAESCLYTGAPILAFLFFDFARRPRLAFFVSPAIQVCLGAAALVGVFLGGYALTLPQGIDLYAFYEYAKAYSTFSGTLPIEADVWTGLFVFVLAISFFIARLRFKEGVDHAAYGPMIFVYVLCIATYFVARSNYRNVHNIIPWALTALAAIVAAPESMIRHIQKTLVLTLGGLTMGFFIAYYPQGHNSNRLTDRYKGLHVYVPIEFEQLTPGVAQAAREAVGSSAFTVINDRALFAQAPELGSYGHALPISPLMHFFLLGDERCRVYTQRMIERVPRSYVLCQDRICPGIPYVFEKMKDIVEVKPVPFPLGKSLGWEIVEITKP